MRTYDSANPCPKCGGSKCPPLSPGELASRVVLMPRGAHTGGTVKAEHVARECRGCGHKWEEALPEHLRETYKITA
jgi:hypothetical protein